MQRFPHLFLLTSLTFAPIQAHGHDAVPPPGDAPKPGGRDVIVREAPDLTSTVREGSNRDKPSKRPETKTVPNPLPGDRIRSFPRPTPEQLQERRKNMRQAEEAAGKQKEAQLERNVRNLIARFGFEGPQLQDAIIAHMVSEVKARGPLRTRSRNLMRTLQSSRSTPDQMARSLAEFKTAADADRERRLAAEEQLNARIDYKNNPRMEAMLLMYGIIGEGSATSAWRPPFSTGDNDNHNRPNRPENREREQRGAPRDENTTTQKTSPEAGLPRVEAPESQEGRVSPEAEAANQENLERDQKRD
jgi:hypothetical protein